MTPQVEVMPSVKLTFVIAVGVILENSYLLTWLALKEPKTLKATIDKEESKVPKSIRAFWPLRNAFEP